MLERVTSNAWWVKALRIVLVFALVFWGTFRVEALAFAAFVNDDLSGHEAGTLSDLDIWKVDETDSTRVISFVRDALGTAADEPQETPIVLTSGGNPVQFVALPAWGDSTTADVSSTEVKIADFVEWKVSDEGIASIRPQGGLVTLTPHAPGTVTVTCRLSDAGAEAASPTFPGEVSFTVQVEEAPPSVVPAYISSITLYKPDGAVVESDKEEITLTDAELQSYGFTAKISVYDESGDLPATYECRPGESLSERSGGHFSDLTWEALKADGSVADAAEVTVVNGEVKLVGDGPYTIRCSSTDGLNGDSVLVQAIVKSKNATPPPPGPEDLQGADHHQNSLTVTIKVPEKANPEGGTEGSPEAPNPDSGENEDAENPEDIGAAEADDPNPSEENAGEPGESTPGEQTPEESTPGEQTPEESTPEGNPNPDANPDADTSAVKAGTTVYTLAELEAALDFGTETYTMRKGDGFTIVTGQGPSFAALLEHVGIPLAEQANIESIDFRCSGDTEEIVSVSWSDLVAANVFYPNAAENDLSGSSHSVTMLAARSYVHEPGEAASQPASADKLLENTRFRLLYGAGGGATISNPDALRWISGFAVNMKGANDKPKPDPGPDPGDDPEVYVDYMPVPKGETAILSPRFYLPESISGGSVQFNYTWEMSADGKTWEAVSSSKTNDTSGSSVQALHVVTDDRTIGTYRRFVLSITQIDGESGSEQNSSVASMPVQIREWNEKDSPVVLALDYVPPIAGDIAVFTVHTKIMDKSINEQDIRYEWQMSTDGGRTWIGEDDPGYPSVLKDATGKNGNDRKTLRIKTEPISSESSSGGSSDKDNKGSNNLLYFRAVAHFYDKDINKRSVASNAQAFTVHVGKPDASDNKAKDVEDALNNNPKPSGDNAPQTPSDNTPQTPSENTPQTSTNNAPQTSTNNAPQTSTNNAPQTSTNHTPQTTPSSSAYDRTYNEPATPRTTVTPVENIVIEDSTTEPQQPALSGSIYINETVTEQVKERNEAMSEAPGYRWTQLSTVNPTSDDVSNILGINPFAPFAVPMALGLTAAGAVEKLIGFRRQIR